jgi:hypothetical protein
MTANDFIEPWARRLARIGLNSRHLALQQFRGPYPPFFFNFLGIMKSAQPNPTACGAAETRHHRERQSVTHSHTPLIHTPLAHLVGDVSCGAALAGRAAAGARPGRCPQPAVWRGATVLRLRWPLSPCLGAAPCGLCLVDGGGGWCCCGAATYAARSVAACNRGPSS